MVVIKGIVFHISLMCSVVMFKQLGARPQPVPDSAKMSTHVQIVSVVNRSLQCT